MGPLEKRKGKGKTSRALPPAKSALHNQAVLQTKPPICTSRIRLLSLVSNCTTVIPLP